jgi:hypothetical protein
MWFAKLFGGRKDDSEPSEHPPHPAALPKAAPGNVRPHNKKAVQPKPTVSKGFDPYNSGTFDKNKAWEKIIR